MSDGGRIVLAATPIGNPADASSRLRELIAEADVIAAEDTRRFGRLASDLGVRYTANLVSFYEAVEQAKVPILIEAASSGRLVLLVTDAGMPSVSDPGYRLVQAAVAAGIPVSVAPGPSAVTAALAVSGLASDRFTFEGFLPRKSGERARRLSELAGERRTMVFFEAPHRADATLAAMAQKFGGERQAAVCRELTKTYEETKRGALHELAQWAQEGLRGEITIVVAGASAEPAELTPAELAHRVQQAESAGAARKDAIAQITKETGLPKRQVYNAVLEHKSTP